MAEFRKIDDNTIEVTKQAPTPAPVTQTYNYDFLLKQRKDIQAQKDTENARRDAELLEVNTLIAEADKLGVVAEPKPEGIV